MQNLESYVGAGSFLAYPIVFLAGILTSLTPCVYPLIPIIVAYMASRGERSKIKIFLLCFMYVLGVAVTFSILGAAAALTGRLFGQIQTSPLAHFIVGNIIILMGLSLLDVFVLPLPRFLRRKEPAKARGGYSGAFGLGFASGFVAAPCTSAILGVLLAYVAAKQNVIFGVTLLFSFALGMGVLLLVLGVFSGLAGTLPKSGPWLTRIQKAFGYLMIALGEYFIIRAGMLLI